MTKDSLIVLCASLFLSFTLPARVQAQRGHAQQTTVKEIRTANPARPVADTTMLHGERQLLADRIEIRRRIQEHKRQRDAEIKEELKKEALEFPAVDLYGEESWGSCVNPFAGQDVTIPSSHKIDLSEFVMPTDRRQVTSSYGYRSRFGRMHYGTDLNVNTGDTIRAAFSGKVRISSYERGGYGNYVVIRHPNGLETVYGHHSRNLVREGTIVRAGDPIALGGSTGRSTGPHLHFEARFMGIPINPEVMFDFNEGVPRLDVFTFRKSGSYQSAASARAMANSRAKAAPSAASISIRTHRVKKGETLHSIARQYGTTVDKLKKTNGLSSKAALKANTSLRIPG